jgi:hypothetical protein
VRQLRRKATARSVPFRQHLRSTTDRAVTAVYYEDTGALLTNRSESPVVLDRIRDLLAVDPEVAAVGQVTSVYVGPHQLLVTAEIQPLDT